MGRSALAAVLGALLALLAATFAPPDAARAEGRIDGEPPRDGMALTTWSGGPAEAIAVAVAEGGGCALRSVHANGPGGIVGYVFGAPDEANRAFLDRYAGGELPAATPILLVCGEPAPPPAVSFGDGEHRVGVDIAPGSYRTTTATDECVWSFGDWLPDGGAAASMAIALIGPDYGTFASSRCGVWEKDPPPIAVPGQPFGDGAWFVGSEVEPGRYRTTTATDECVWERLGDRGSRRVYRSWGSPAAIALIQWPDAAFTSRGCGTWERETAAVAAPMPTFGDGAWFVGSEVEPGAYRTATATDECEQQRLGDRSHDGIRIARWAAVLIDPEDVAFTTSGCGIWEQEPSPPVEPGQPFGDGAWFVGSEVEPGRYRTTTPTEECEWGRVVAGGYGDDSWYSSFAMAIAVIEPDDAVFVSGGCGEWSRIAAPLAEPGEAIGDGAWLVGSEVAPGRYRAARDADGCRWELAERARASILPPGSRQPLRYGGGLTIVDIKPDDFSFSTGGCGWTTDLTPRVEPGQPFGDGTWLVGTEIAPGRYLASMADSCFWYRWEYRFAGFGGYREAGRLTIVDIAPDDVGFTSIGCGVWSNDPAPRVEPGQPFGDGTWLVGPEIAPGLYRADGADASSCRWERLSDFRYHSEYYWAPGNIDTGSRAFVDIAPGDAGFHTRGCGVWTPAP